MQENKDAASKTNSSACTRRGVTAPSKSGGKAEKNAYASIFRSSEEGLVFLFTFKLMQYGGGQQCGRVRAAGRGESISWSLASRQAAMSTM